MKIRTTIYIEEEVLQSLDKKAKLLNLPRSTVISSLANSKLHNLDIKNQLDETSLNKILDSYFQKVKDLLDNAKHNTNINQEQGKDLPKGFQIVVVTKLNEIISLLTNARPFGEDDGEPKGGPGYIP
jgi:ABC-type uncharacterized transport system substrate-binding protein